MSDADFYNRNLFRQYPQRDEVNVFTNTLVAAGVVVDFGIAFYPASGFDEADEAHRVYLIGSGTVAGSVGVNVGVVAPGAVVDIDTIVVIPDATQSDLQFKSFTLQASDGEPWAYGFVVIGKLENFPTIAWANPIAAVSAAPDDYRDVERRCIQVLRGHFVNRFHVNNELRTRVPNQESSSSSGVSSVAYPVAPGSPVDGDVRFQEGYNCSISVLERVNGIRFSAVSGAGEGPACEEVPRTAAEVALIEAGDTLDNAVRCDEVITNINGVQPSVGGSFALRPGRGIEITSPADHTIRIAGRASLENCD